MVTTNGKRRRAWLGFDTKKGWRDPKITSEVTGARVTVSACGDSRRLPR
jgi:hypothetical protein